METLHTDCLVVGAGPAGATVARLMALKGRDVIVADPGASATNRLELLAPASLATVAALGLEPLLHDPAVARHCLGIRRTRGSGERDYEDFLRHPYRVGYVVDRARFDERLREAAIAAGAKFCRLRATGVMQNGGVVFRENVGGGTRLVLANVVVDATGRAAAIGRRKSVRVTARDRRVAELIEDIHVNEATGASWLEYRSNGSSWSYRIYGPDGRAQTWRIRASGPATGTARFTVDASARTLSAAAGEGWIAVGDAAIAFDPIASQGLYNALSSALVATGALMSTDRLSPTSARLYSNAVAATFLLSEAGRVEVYKTGAIPATPPQDHIAAAPQLPDRLAAASSF